jgi:hypothetical protein
MCLENEEQRALDRLIRILHASANMRAIFGFAVGSSIVIFTLFISIKIPVKDDVAWLLYVAEQWIGGHRPYVALMEINPPLIIWISVVPVVLARLLGLSSLLVAPLFFAVILIGCVWWAVAILHRRDIRYDRILTFGIVTAVLVLVPGVDFWQREHLLTAAALPYLAFRMGRSVMLSPSRRAFSMEALFAGALVGLCCSLKPWYVLPFVLVEWVAVANGARFLREAALGACVTGLLFIVAVAIFHPEYMKVVVPLAVKYYKVENPTWQDLLIESRRFLTGLAATIVLWWADRRNPIGRSETRILLVFAFGSAAAYILQGKGYYYQAIPAVAATLLVLLGIATASLRYLSFRNLSVHRLGVCFLAGAIFLGLAQPKASQLMLMAQGIAATPSQRIQLHLTRVLRAKGARSYVAFSHNLGIGFPVVNETGVAWASRFPSAWVLYATHLQTLNGMPGPNVMWPVVDWMVQDFVAICPDLVAIDGRDGVDYLYLLQQNANFAQIWTTYRLISTFEGVRVYFQTKNCNI